MLVVRLLVGLVVSGWLLVGSAIASPVKLNTWYEFKLAGEGKPLQASDVTLIPFFDVFSLQAPEAPWEFTLVDDGSLIVTDAFLSIDQFEIFDQGHLLGTTSVPTAGSDCFESLGCALFDPAFSKSVFYLDAGFHAITGVQILGRVGAGAFIIISSTPIPLPAGLPLFLTGLAVLRFVSRWRPRGA